MVSSGQVVLRRRWRIQDGVDCRLKPRFLLLLVVLVLPEGALSLYCAKNGVQNSLSFRACCDYNWYVMCVRLGCSGGTSKTVGGI